MFDMISTFSENSKDSSYKFNPRTCEIKPSVSFISIYMSIYLWLLEVFLKNLYIYDTFV